MFVLEAPLERGLRSHRDVEARVAALRCQIALYRQQLRQSFDPDFTAIYAREIADAQFELASLLDSAGPNRVLNA